MSIKFNREKFWTAYREEFGKVQQSQVNAIEFLLDQFEAESTVWNLISEIAYGFATIKHETANTFEPIQEFGGTAYFEKRYGYQTKVGKSLGNDAKGEGAKYSGKGYVQLTGESNYERLELKLRQKYPDAILQFESLTGQTFDLTDYADQAKNPKLAFLIMTIGMNEGVYTGKKLSDYFSSTKKDYEGARKIINGTDKKDLIAGYARQFEDILNSSTSKTTVKVETKPTEKLLPAPQESLPVESDTTNTQVSVVDGQVKVSTKTNEQPTETKTVAPPSPYGFISKIKAEIATLLGINVTAEGAKDALTQSQTIKEYLPFSPEFWSWLVTLILIASAVYIAYRLIHYLVEEKRKQNSFAKVIDAIADKNKNDVVITNDIPLSTTGESVASGIEEIKT